MLINQSKQTALFKALVRILKPLIRLMLSHGILFTQFTDWLKQLYVDTAIQHFSFENKVITDSRISILTGVHRKDVKRIREQIKDTQDVEIPENINLGSQIISAWLNSPELNENDKTKKIARLKKQAGDISFEALVEKVTKDVRSRAVLDELERVGAVTIDENDMVNLVTDAFIPSKGQEEKTFYLGLGVGDHANAAVHNVLGYSPPFFDRIIHYNHFSDQDIQEIEAFSREQSSQLLQLINTKAEKLSQASSSNPNNQKRFSLGIYFYQTDEKGPENV